MRGKSMILIVIALGCGLVASIGISQILDSRGGGDKTQTKKIFVAVKDIDINTPLTPEIIKLEEWPVEKIREGAIDNLEDIKDMAPNQRLYAGEPILRAKLFDPSSSGGESLRIPKGYRVQAIKVKAEDVAGGLVKPGDHVDVLVYLRKGGNISQTTTRTILKDARVFAVGAQTSVEHEKDGKTISAKTVSLLLQPGQVETMLLASRLGQISLSLRRPDDDGDVDTEGATAHQMLSGSGEDATPGRNTPHNSAGLAKSNGGAAASEFKEWLAGITSKGEATSGPNQAVPTPDQLASTNKWEMVVMSANDAITYEVENSNKMSIPQVVSGGPVFPASPGDQAADTADDDADSDADGPADADVDTDDADEADIDDNADFDPDA